ncbi:hypothetical protein ONZ51_g6283 [Trametes cubensis]|uniref:F-box domain-containing protein n=1 Tax=Trametes cubensis TaxID=1111947 RepID=A0AAD7XA69_9APHY|nr:hypothetical protein ONZ51_g6283 [Trametes cubensis]
MYIICCAESQADRQCAWMVMLSFLQALSSYPSANAGSSAFDEELHRFKRALHRRVAPIFLVGKVCTALAGMTHYELPVVFPLMPSMSSVALILEILTLICEYADRPTLALMARSSSVLHEPAIQVLWRFLPTLVPLVMCLPKDAWELTGRGVSFQLSITRVLAPRDWSSFLKYSALVRMLGYDFNEYKRMLGYHEDQDRRVYRQNIKPSNDLWDKLCAYKPTPILFPNLRVLCWFSLGLKSNHLASILVSANRSVQELRIEDVRIEDRDGAKALEDAVRVIVGRLPHLRKLILQPTQSNSNVPPDGVRVNDPVSDLARSLTSIVSMDCRGMPHRATSVVALAHSKTLVNLTIRLPNGVLFSQLFPSIATEQLFPNLLAIRLLGTLQAYNSFGNAVQLPTVRKVRIDLGTGSRPAELSALFPTVRRQFCPNALEVLHITSSDGALSQASLDAAHFRHLLPFKHMKSFILYQPFRLSIDDTLLLDMVSAWPALRKLTLLCSMSCGCDGHANPILSALPSLAFRCTGLQELVLHLDATCWASDAEFARDDELGDVYTELKNTQSLSQLHTLDVGSSPITAPDSVASFLSRIFPSLAEVKFSRSAGFRQVDTSQVMAWHAVDTFFAIRSQRGPPSPRGTVTGYQSE